MSSLEEPKQYQTWNEWLANFFEDENYYGSHDGDEGEERHGTMSGDDPYYDDGVDASILETLMIVILAGALVVLVYYRQLRQQLQGRNVEMRNHHQDDAHPAQPDAAIEDLPGGAG